MESVERLLEVMRRLRDPLTGCPWDLEQTFASIVPHTIEEAYEVADAIERQDMAALPEELGDLLFQVVFYAHLGSEQDAFDFEAVAAGIADKLVERHPHVFAGVREDDVQRLRDRWESSKAAERRRKAQASGKEAGLLDDVSMALPALSRTQKLQARAARAGFDWPEIGPVLEKLREEIAEFEAVLGAGGADRGELADELGDILFSSVNLARHAGLDAESVLRAANGKFESRFRAIEARLAEQGRHAGQADLAELDALWESVKAEE